jgi:hypothetical protein
MKDINLVGNEKGTTAVETAIIIMLLLIFIFGIIEFGLLLFNKQVLTNASREGARAGIVVGLGRSGGDAAEYLAWSKYVADDYCADHLVTFGSGDLTILTGHNDLDGDGSPSRGDDLRVSITYDYDFSFFPFPTVPLYADTIMKLE